MLIQLIPLSSVVAKLGTMTVSRHPVRIPLLILSLAKEMTVNSEPYTCSRGELQESDPCMQQYNLEKKLLTCPSRLWVSQVIICASSDMDNLGLMLDDLLLAT